MVRSLSKLAGNVEPVETLTVGAAAPGDAASPCGVGSPIDAGSSDGAEGNRDWLELPEVIARAGRSA